MYNSVIIVIITPAYTRDVIYAKNWFAHMLEERVQIIILSTINITQWLKHVLSDTNTITAYQYTKAWEYYYHIHKSYNLPVLVLLPRSRVFYRLMCMDTQTCLVRNGRFFEVGRDWVANVNRMPEGDIRHRKHCCLYSCVPLDSYR